MIWNKRGSKEMISIIKPTIFRFLLGFLNSTIPPINRVISISKIIIAKTINWSGFSPRITFFIIVSFPLK